MIQARNAGYEDFAIRIEPGEYGELHSRVMPSGGGSESGLLELPGGLDDLQDLVQLFEAALHPGSEEETGALAREIGGRLYDALFSPPIERSFFFAKGRISAEVRGKRKSGLRIRLVLDPDIAEIQRLACLPWELLYNSLSRQFLCHNSQTPLVRYISLAHPAIWEPEPVSGPLRILVLLSTPRDAAPLLSLEKECELLDEIWGGIGGIELTFIENTTISDLRRKLYDVQPHVLHFMGHGDFDEEKGEGALLFESPQGRMDLVTGRDLTTALQGSPCLRLAFLNSCHTGRFPRRQSQDPFSGVAAALLMSGLPAVVAMQFAVTDEAAATFSGGFYEALAAGEPTDAAVTEGRRSVSLAHRSSYEWAAPVLFLQVEDGKIFSLRENGSLSIDQFPLGPRVDFFRVTDDLVHAYKEFYGEPAKAMEILGKATRIRLAADSDDGHVTYIQPGDLPLIGVVGPYAFWSAAFQQACLHGPRMVAALLLASDHQQFLKGAREDREALLQHLRHEEGLNN